MMERKLFQAFDVAERKGHDGDSICLQFHREIAPYRFWQPQFPDLRLGYDLPNTHDANPNI
jgi:hypothetical protein